MRLLVVLVLMGIFRAKGGLPSRIGDHSAASLIQTEDINGTVICVGVQSLQTLSNDTQKITIRDISLPHAEALVDDLFRLLPRLSHFVCTNCSLSDLANVTFGESGSLEALDLSGNKIKRLPEAAATTFNLASLKALDLSNNAIRVIEWKPFKTLSSLEVLNLSANVIDTLNASSFSGLSSLQCLDLSANRLTQLDGELFAPLTSLQHLNLSNNLLEILDEACLGSLLRLQQLDVSWNRLARVAPGSLHLPSLARLLLSGNSALGESQEPALIVGPGKRLQTVDVSRTGLKQVPTALTHSIRTLRLAGNSIQTVNCGDLDSYPLLQLLDFSANKLRAIEDDALGRLDLLSILYLTDNNLRAFPRMLPEKLKVLHLEHNKIENIFPEDLQGMPLLEVLLLSDNKVKVVREGAFSQLGSLATLDLSRNPISILPPGSLSGPDQLQVLRLSHLQILPPVKDMAFPLSTPDSLLELDLSGSPGLVRQFLADTAALAASKALQELDLSESNLKNIRPDLLHFLPQLRTLRIRNNYLNCTHLQWLAVLMRRYNLPEYRQVTCSHPLELSGTLLIDLQDEEMPTTKKNQLHKTQQNSSLPSLKIGKSAPIVQNTTSNLNSTTIYDRKYNRHPGDMEHINKIMVPLNGYSPGFTSSYHSIKTVVGTIPFSRDIHLNKSTETTSLTTPQTTSTDFHAPTNLEIQNATASTAKRQTSMIKNEKPANGMSLHPGALVLILGVLSSTALLVILSFKSKRRRKNITIEDNIEVSSLPSVTELW